MREIVSLICDKCKNRNHYTTKNKKVKKEKLEIKKYCPTCNKHILHKEGRA
ncbi:50S ribosomal protein L33 [bacterium]|nr:50S ribosomal protein L33 [bacterium]